MNCGHRVLHALASLMVTIVFLAPAHAYPAKEWRFNVLLDNKPIGHHTFSLSMENNHERLRSEAHYRVTILGFTAYEYQHNATERWQGGCLTEIESHTSDNGDVSKLRGKREKQGFVLNGPQGESTLPDCIMSFAYWNPQILNQARLLNAQNGEYLPVRVEDLGKEIVSRFGNNVMAKRYRLITSKFFIDLWYGTGNQWLALETRTEGGRLLRYEIGAGRYRPNQRDGHA